MAISPQQLTIYLYSAHRAVIFAKAQLSSNDFPQMVTERPLPGGGSTTTLGGGTAISGGVNSAGTGRNGPFRPVSARSG